MLIATRNRARFLPDAIATALGQEDVDVEVVVVDDASDDETPELLGAIDDPRVRTLRMSPQVGQSEAKNAGLATARGAWIALLDDDDLWAPHKLRRQLDAARAANATWVYCGVLLVSPEGDVVPTSRPPEPGTVLRELLQGHVVQAAASSVVVDAERLRAVGAFEDDLASPRDLLIRLAQDGPAAAVGEPLVAYRRHAATFISRNRDRALAEARHVQRKHRSLELEHGVRFDFDHFERWLRSEEIRARRRAAETRLREGRRVQAARAQLLTLARSRSWRDLRRLLRIAAGERARTAFRRAIPPDERPPANQAPAWLSAQLDEAAANR